MKIIIKKTISDDTSERNTLTAVVHPERSPDNRSVAAGCFWRMSRIAGG